ncbi:MAG: hypothetical protein JNM63_17275 [Spirochaetia bacterium]|nr:hypothetical protein [Spirochaetia bacterium]
MNQVGSNIKSLAPLVGFLGMLAGLQVGEILSANLWLRIAFLAASVALVAVWFVFVQRRILKRRDDLQRMLSPVPANLSLKARGLHVLIRQLMSVHDQIETTASELAKSFFDINRQAKQQSTKTAEIFRVLSGGGAEGGESVLGSTKHALTELSAHFQNASRIQKTNLESITRIAAQADLIETQVRSIDGLAQQTNILALNASIEASRAGSKGRGFAVVAEEVRRLSALTDQSTSEIRGSLAEVVAEARRVKKEIGESFEEMTRLSAAADRIFGEGVLRIDTTVGQVRVELESLKDDTTSLAKSTQQAVFSMQFHDILRQRVEHVLAPLKNIHEELLALLETLPDEAPVKNGDEEVNEINQWLSKYYTMKEETEVLRSALAPEVSAT